MGSIAGAAVAVAAFGLWPSAVPVEAFGSDSSENVTLCTVPLDAGLEAVVVLDHITGELTGAVMSPKSGQFFGLYKYQGVNKDLGALGKSPKYTMVSGAIELQNQTGAGRYANGVIYIAEETSGQTVAYGMPWIPSAKSNPKPFNQPFRKFHQFTFRTAGRRGAAVP
jgi:hypothetical protein